MNASGHRPAGGRRRAPRQHCAGNCPEALGFDSVSRHSYSFYENLKASSSMPTMQEFQPTMDAWADKNDCDIICWFGDIARGKDTYLIKQSKTVKRRKNALLLLCTRGGDPNAAYRTMRGLQTAYQTVVGKRPGSQPIQGEVKVSPSLLIASARVRAPL